MLRAGGRVTVIDGNLACAVLSDLLHNTAADW